LECIRILGKGSGWAWEKGAGFPLHPSLGSSHLFVHKVRRAHIQSMVVTHYVNIALLLDNQLTATCFHCINKQSIFVHLSIRPIPHRHQASHNRIDPNCRQYILTLISHPHPTMRTKVAQVLPLARLSGNHPCCWVTKQRTAPSFNPTQSSLKSYHVIVVPSATRKPEIFFLLCITKPLFLDVSSSCFPCLPYHISFPPFPMPLSPLPFLFAWLIAFSDSQSTCLCTILYQNCFALDDYPQGKQILYVK